MTTKTKLVWVSETGHVLGDDHPQCKLSDAAVDEIRDAFESGAASYDTLAAQYGVSKTLIAGICRYEKRATTRAATKRVVDRGDSRSRR